MAEHPDNDPKPEHQDSARGNAARGWSDYWREDGAAGEVFIGKDGSTNPHLDAFWAERLADLDSGSMMIDIACGAGSVFKHVPADRDIDLVASDLSTEALTLLEERTPGAFSAAASAAELPFADATFDRVVSQFGIEYAGRDAFAEAARLIKHGGEMIALAHIEDGYIDSKNRELLAGAEMAENLNFIPLAADLTRAAFGQGNFEAAASGFQPAERALAAYVAQRQGGIHGHLYTGFRQLFERRQQYALEDIIGWLDAMADDLERNIMRLGSMRAAALSSSDIESIRQALANIGVQVTATPLQLPDHSLPVAWQMLGTRP